MADDKNSKPQREASAPKKMPAASTKKAVAKKAPAKKAVAKKALAEKAVAKKAPAKKAVAKKAVAKKAPSVDPITAALNEAIAAQASRASKKSTPEENARPKPSKAAASKALVSTKRPGPLVLAVAALAISTISVGFALYQRATSSGSSCTAATSSIRDFMKENPDKAVISETQRDSFLAMKNDVADKCSYTGARLILETEVAAWLGAPTNLSQVAVVPPANTPDSATTSTLPAPESQPAGR